MLFRPCGVVPRGPVRRFVSILYCRSDLAVGPRRMLFPSNRIQPVRVIQGTWSWMDSFDRRDRCPFPARSSLASSASRGLRRCRYLNDPIACASVLPRVSASSSARNLSVRAKYRGPAHSDRASRLLTIQPRPAARRIRTVKVYLSGSADSGLMSSRIMAVCNTSRQDGPLLCSRQ